MNLLVPELKEIQKEKRRRRYLEQGKEWSYILAFVLIQWWSPDVAPFFSNESKVNPIYDHPSVAVHTPKASCIAMVANEGSTEINWPEIESQMRLKALEDQRLEAAAAEIERSISERKAFSISTPPIPPVRP
jgi:hypothetical protein